MVSYTIQPTSNKGRSFSAELVASILSARIEKQTAKRPAWAMFAGSDTALKPFMANLRLGRKAETGRWKPRPEERIEFLKSDYFQVAWQRETEGTLATIYHPELFNLDPGLVEPTAFSFILLVPKYWIDRQTTDYAPAIKHVKRLRSVLDFKDGFEKYAPASTLFAAYLDRRTRCPLIADVRFYFQLLIAGLVQGMVSTYQEGYSYRHRDDWDIHTNHGFEAQGLREVGIHTALSVHARQQDFEAFLAEQAKIYFEATR